YSCLSCGKWYQINRAPARYRPEHLTRLHLNGMSFRTLAREYDLSLGKTYQVVTGYLSRLIHCADLTRRFCTRFSGILLVDGKYLKVKGYSREVPVIYGVDYASHDIPTYALTRGESLTACKKFFGSLKLTNYPLLT